jgi:hypothetical protein
LAATYVNIPDNGFTGRVDVALAHVTGATALSETFPRTRVAAVVAIVMVAGIGAALWDRRLRRVTALMCVAAIIVVAVQYSRDNTYSLQRFIMIAQPTLALPSYLGLLVGASAAWRLGRSELRTGQVAAVGAIGACVAFVCFVQATTHLRSTPSREALVDLTVKPEVREVVSWARAVGGPTGADVAVLVDDYVDRMWIADGLRDREDVTYPYLLPDYFGRSSFTDGRPPRFLLTSRKVFTDAPPSAVVKSSARYVLYDLRGIDAWFAMPVDGFWGMEPAGTADHNVNWASQDVSMVTMRTSPSVTISLDVRPNPSIPVPVTVGVRLPDRDLGRFVVAQPSSVELPLAGAPLVSIVRFDADHRNTEISAAFPRPAVYEIEGALVTT